MTPIAAARLFALTAMMGLCGAASARAESYIVTKLLKPSVLETQYIGIAHQDEFSCWPNICIFVDPFPYPQPQSAFYPDVLVGFDFFGDTGTGPCNCAQYFSYAYRGLVMFRAEDIPHCGGCGILAATLYLEPDHVEQKGSISSEAVGGLFEVSDLNPTYDDSDAINFNAFDALFAGYAMTPMYPGLVVRTAPGGPVVLTRRAGLLGFPAQKNPVFDPFPIGPLSQSPMIKKKPGFAYEIDVSKAVQSWVANSPNVSGLHGFVVAGLNEDLPQDQTTKLVVTYIIRLEVVYQEPVL
jgi:hypothetical protein